MVADAPGSEADPDLADLTAQLVWIVLMPNSHPVAGNPQQIVPVLRKLLKTSKHFKIVKTDKCNQEQMHSEL